MGKEAVSALTDFATTTTSPLNLFPNLAILLSLYKTLATIHTFSFPSLSLCLPLPLMEEHFPHFHFSSPYLSIPPRIQSIPPPPQLQPVLPPPPPVQPEAIDRERLPQWTHAETAEFLSIRADLDASFMSTKRNKPLWEAISARLQHKGFARTPDQCKSKWKNLVTRFKVKIPVEAFSSHLIIILSHGD